MKQTRQSVHAVKQSIYLDIYGFSKKLFQSSILAQSSSSYFDFGICLAVYIFNWHIERNLLKSSFFAMSSYFNKKLHTLNICHVSCKKMFKVLFGQARKQVDTVTAAANGVRVNQHIHFPPNFNDFPLSALPPSHLLALRETYNKRKVESGTLRQPYTLIYPDPWQWQLKKIGILPLQSSRSVIWILCVSTKVITSCLWWDTLTLRIWVHAI